MLDLVLGVKVYVLLSLRHWARANFFFRFEFKQPTHSNAEWPWYGLGDEHKQWTACAWSPQLAKCSAGNSKASGTWLRAACNYSSSFPGEKYFGRHVTKYELFLFNRCTAGPSSAVKTTIVRMISWTDKTKKAPPWADSFLTSRGLRSWWISGTRATRQ